MTALGQISNPFKSNVVTDAWQPLVLDVPAIHQEAFERCRNAFEGVRRRRQTDSVLLHGPAGSGKTHLLARLQRYLNVDQGNGHSDRLLRAIFVSVPLSTSAHGLWPHLRRRFVDDLLRPLQGETNQLQRLVAFRMSALDPQRRSARDWLLWVRRQSAQETPNLRKNLEILDQHSQLGLELGQALSLVLMGKNVADARAWLRGDGLPESALRRLDLSLDPVDERDREDQAREMVLALCRLAAPGLPIVVCFDQIEALQAHRQDQDALFRFGQMAAALFNHSKGVLLISCIQSSVLDHLRDAVRQSDWDRLARTVGVLDPLDAEQGRRLVARRLRAWPELAPMRAEHPDDELWPIPWNQLEPLFASGASTARRIITHAAFIFDQLGGRPPEAADLDEHLSTAYDRYRLEALLRSGPGETDENLRHGLTLLSQVLGPPWAIDPRVKGDADMTLVHDRTRYRISLCNHLNMGSLAARLRRLESRAGQKGYQHVILIRDPRLPISPTAARTRRLLSGLIEKKAPLYEPPVEALAGLKALRQLMSETRAGDLAHHGEAVPEEAVREWLVRNLDPALKGLFEDMIHQTQERLGDDAELWQDLAALLDEVMVAPLDEVQKRLGLGSLERLEDIIRRRPDRIGWLQGPPALLFSFVPADVLNVPTGGEPL